MLSIGDVAAIRERFPVFRDKIYLNSCSQGALSDAVRAAFMEYLESWDLHGSPWDIWVEEYERARGVFAHFIGASADEVAIIPSASAGINAIASALSFSDRPKIALGVFDFPTMGHVWMAQRRRGAEVCFVEAMGDRLPAQQYESVVDDRTAIVPVAGLCFMNGWRAELKGIVEFARSQGALVMLDDYQDCGTRPVDVKALGVDFYVSGMLKYVLGPPGVAMMYVRSELVNELVPAISGWFAQAHPFAFDLRTLDLSPTARRFEAGTPPVPNLYAAGSSVELLTSIGMQNVSQHIAGLAAMLVSGATELGFQLKTAVDTVGPLIVLKCTDSEALVRRLAEQNIVVSNRHDGLRIGLHVYNTREDIEILLAALEANRTLLVQGKSVAA